MPDGNLTKHTALTIRPTAIYRQQDPMNVEFSFNASKSFVTPQEHFYIRNHFEMPVLDASTYRLQIEGEVQTWFELTLAEIEKMKPVSVHATLECAGNGRVFLVPQVRGAQWELGAVSTAKWTGVLLSDVLDRAGVGPSAVEVVFEGADQGRPAESPKPPSAIHYAHSIPFSKVPDVLLAYAMNDQPLHPAHGFPLRVIVPGWYGMASVKWVTRIIASATKFQGYFRTIDYAYWMDQSGNPVRVPIEEMSVKSQIARPTRNEIVPRDTDYLVTGAAWSGESVITAVELSTDGGMTYQPADLLGDPIRHAWRLWQHRWRTPLNPGAITLHSRATDARGRTQPAGHDTNHGSYIINHVLPAEVIIA